MAYRNINLKEFMKLIRDTEEFRIEITHNWRRYRDYFDGDNLFTKQTVPEVFEELRIEQINLGYGDEETCIFLFGEDYEED